MNKTLSILAMVFIVSILSGGLTASYAEISVRQDGLTDAEKKVLDDIAEAKASGTYIPLPEAALTADIRVYSEDISLAVTHPVDLEAVHCWTNFELYVPTTHCILPGFPPHPDDKFFDSETGQWLPVEPLIESYKDEIKAESGNELTREQRYNQERIDYIKQRTNPSDLELQELALREQLGALCRNDTLVSQKYREFDVATEIFLDHEGNWREQLKVDHTPTTDTARDNRFVLDLQKQVQECIGQPYTKKSAQYDHIVVDGLFTKDPNKPELPDAVTAEMVNIESNKGVTMPEGISAICNSHNSDRTKKMYGCPMPEPDPSTIPAPEMRDVTSSTAWQQWYEYQIDNGASQKNKIIDSKQTEIYNRYFR
jgi:hypothetical protein